MTIKVLSRNSTVAFENDLDSFLSLYPSAEILYIHARGIEGGKGYAAILKYDGKTKLPQAEPIVEPKIEEPEPELEEKVEIVKEVKEIINDKLEELEPGKVQCPECKKMFTKGGAFVTHYKSHFNES